MEIKEAQKLVDDWIKTVGVRYFSELTNMAILTEEVGELARIMARKYGDQSFREPDKDMNMADEMADVLGDLEEDQAEAILNSLQGLNEQEPAP